MIQQSKEIGYSVSLLFFWLNSSDVAVNRVKIRVKEGGHHIPENIIKRRYDRGLNNFFQLYHDIVDDRMFIDNSGENYEIVAYGTLEEKEIINQAAWKDLIEKTRNEKQ